MNHVEYKQFVYDIGTKEVVYEQDRIDWAIEEMVAEAGECLSLTVKAKRKGKKIDKEKLYDELADTFWGLTAVMNEAFPGATLEDLMSHNYRKLKAREAAAKAS